jgi:hypothetical protein
MNYQVTGWIVWTPFVILGLFSNLDSKLNFTSHIIIDSLVVKASRMLGYIRRIGRDSSGIRIF